MSTVTPLVRRAAKYGVVGITGIPIDLGIVWLASQLHAHWLVATLAGYLAAVTWNYNWHRRLVYHSDSRLLLEYLRYCGADVSGAAIRLLVVAILITRTPFGVVFASFAGITAAAGIKFGLAERYVFRGRKA